MASTTQQKPHSYASLTVFATSALLDMRPFWFRSYLFQRSQFVKMDNFSSSLTSLNSGVPQGFVLGPILFSLYTSPMCSIIVQHDLLFHQFADDITLFTGVSHPDPSPTLLKLSSCLSALNSWFSQSQLKLNPTKSEVMFVSSSRFLAKYNLPSVVTLDGTTLPISSKLKILGVTLDSNLNFAYFISQIIQSSNFHIYAIKQVRKFLPLSAANALFISLVLSRLDYCNSLFCGQPNYLLCKLQALQNHAAKTVLQADYFSSSSDYLDRLHWLPGKDASLNYFGSLHALLSLNNLLIFFVFCQSDTHVNHSDPCTLVSSFINLFLQACLLVALFFTRLHVCEIHFLLTCAHRLLS